MEVNFDVLILITRSLAKSSCFNDISAMTRTCRFLHVECTSLLLTPRTIYLNHEVLIDSFCRFMLSDKRRRFPLLSRCHSLMIYAHALSEPVIDLLTEALGHVTTLRRLCLPEFEHFMLSSPRVFPAFATLSNIYYLDLRIVDGLGKRFYVKLLKMMRTSLKGISLTMPAIETTPTELLYVVYDRNVDPLWLFSSFSSTLESIVVVGRTTVEACSKVHVYPRLTSLTISTHCMPLLLPYIQAFPSLQDLRFDYTLFSWTTASMPTHRLSLDTLRGRSSDDLRRRNREDQSIHGSWSALKYFMGTTLDAYIAGITCHIDTLHLIAWGGTMEGEVSAICALFADARPTLFHLALRPPHIDNGYLAALFSQRFETFSTLSSLQLRVDVTVVPFDFKAYFDAIGTALKLLPILSLKVEIKCLTDYALIPHGYGKKTYCDSLWWPSDSHCWTLDELSKEDMEAHLRYFLDMIPSLRQATIAYARCSVDMPHRIITMDLDAMPHTIDRPGREADASVIWHDGY